MVHAVFGPAGTSDSYIERGYKNQLSMPEYLKEFGLEAYEYQCGHGLKVSDQTAENFGNVMAQSGIVLSLHAPYYISLSSIEQEKRDKSVTYIWQSARLAHLMGAKRIIVHTGSCGKLSRADALALAADTLRRALQKLEEEALADHVTICPETMGKINQLGTLEEVLTLCKLDDRLIPCIDFGHLNARTLGAIRTKEDYRAILDATENALGADRLKNFHAHFSKIEYTAGGEKRHLTFADTVFGPDFDPLAELIAQKALTPTIICESAGTQAEDAAAMMQMYRSYLNR